MLTDDIPSQYRRNASESYPEWRAWVAERLATIYEVDLDAITPEQEHNLRHLYDIGLGHEAAEEAIVVYDRLNR